MKFYTLILISFFLVSCQTKMKSFPVVYTLDSNFKAVIDEFIDSTKNNTEILGHGIMVDISHSKDTVIIDLIHGIPDNLSSNVNGVYEISQYKMLLIGDSVPNKIFKMNTDTLNDISELMKGKSNNLLDQYHVEPEHWRLFIKDASIVKILKF